MSPVLSRWFSSELSKMLCGSLYINSCWIFSMVGQIGLKIDMRKVFRFTVSNIFNFIASWMTAWCVTNPNLQGNLAWILLVHHTKITKWSWENQIARNSGGNSGRKAKQTQGKPSVRSLRNDASNCVFSPYGLHTRGVPRASQSAPAVGNPSRLNRVLSQGKIIILATFICNLLTLFYVIPLYCALPLALAEEHKLTLFRGNRR